jgi:uncharacterized protein (DUF1697 family)
VTTTYVALLRSVNVAGHGTIKMDRLRQAFTKLGFTDVSTYIQSGNVIFSHAASVRSGALEQAIEAELGSPVTVMLRTAKQLAKLVDTNPFPDVDTSKLHVGFMTHAPDAAAVRKLEPSRFSPETVVVSGADAYLHLPNGMGRAKLPDYLSRKLTVPITFRNWNTTTKLAQLAAA